MNIELGKNAMKSSLLALLCASFWLFESGPVHAAETWQVGVAREVITPPEFMWMSGYGARSAPADGAIHDLYARVACFSDPSGRKSVFISTDLVGVPRGMSQRLSKIFEEEFRIPRAGAMFACSHTHCGPALDDPLSFMLDMQPADWEQVRKYQAWLEERILAAVRTAVADLSDAELSFANGVCGFASNRRAPQGIGPVDHEVPVLKIADRAGKIRGIIFGYACHNTTLGIQQWCGDYAGFAQLYLEETHPGAVAMFFSGCGADQNPLPRRELELCEQYGRLLAVAVKQTLAGKLEPLPCSLAARFEEIDLAFDSLPTREQVVAKLENGSRYEKAWAKNMLAELDAGGIAETYPYPVQVWRVGGKLTWVALGGEVVVDYSLRLKKDLRADAPGRTVWVTGYANDVMAYIPSERVLTEGGYEGAGAMLYYQKPSAWKAGLEQQIVDTVRKLAVPD